MKERQIDGYEERGATRLPIVAVRRIGGSWRPFSTTRLVGPDFMEASDYAHVLAVNIPKNNSPAALAEAGIEEIAVIEAWVYSNGQVCSSVITVEPPPIPIVMTGKSYVALSLDDPGNLYPIEENWPEPSMRRIGKGRQYTFLCDSRQAKLIVSLMEETADVLDGSGDPDASADKSALRRDAARGWKAIKRPIIREELS